VLGGQAGLHLVLGLPAQADDEAIARAVAEAGITCRPLSLYHLGRLAPAPGLLLGYGAVDEDEIARNFARLAAVLQRRL
jgi:GntR family transcriptional regulator/MocR family aminotransferase